MSDIEKGTVDGTVERTAFAHAPAQYTPRPSNIANPEPLGLFCFGSSAFILGLFNLQTRGVTHPNVLVGMALCCGGLAQFLAGMWEFARGETFGGTVFTSYAAFWLSYAAILLPGTGIGAAYVNKRELQQAIGIFLICWGLVSCFLLIAALRRSIALISLFGFVIVTIACLVAGEFLANENATKAGGGIGMGIALNAWYLALSHLLDSEPNPIIRLPRGIIRRSS